MTTQAIKIVVRGLLSSGDEWRQMFYCSGNDDFTDTTISNFIAGLYGTLTGNVGSGTSIYGADVAVRLAGSVDTDPLGWGASDFVAVTWTGSDAGEPLPPADCMLVLGRTGIKHVMGRKFIPGIVESKQTNGILAAGVLTALNNFGAYWINPTANPLGTPGTMCVWGPRHGFVPLIGTRSQSHVFHLRKRQVGRGI